MTRGRPASPSPTISRCCRPRPSPASILAIATAPISASPASARTRSRIMPPAAASTATRRSAGCGRIWTEWVGTGRPRHAVNLEGLSTESAVRWPQQGRRDMGSRRTFLLIAAAAIAAPATASAQETEHVFVTGAAQEHVFVTGAAQETEHVFVTGAAQEHVFVTGAAQETEHVFVTGAAQDREQR